MALQTDIITDIITSLCLFALTRKAMKIVLCDIFLKYRSKDITVEWKICALNSHLLLEQTKMVRNLRSASTKAKGKGRQAKSVKLTVATDSKMGKAGQNNLESMAYERLYAKVQENKRKREQNELKTQPKSKRTAVPSTSTGKNAQESAVATAQFAEDDSYMVYEVGEMQEKSTFPTPSEEEDNNHVKDGEILEVSENNNASLAVSNPQLNFYSSTVRSLSATASPQRQVTKRPTFLDEGPCTSDIQTVRSENDQLRRSILIMQELMIKKGFLTSDELNDVLGAETEEMDLRENPGPEQVWKTKTKGILVSTGKAIESNESGNPDNRSEVTIYRGAVRQVLPVTGDKIDKFLNNARESEERRNISSSSEELMDTSDESELAANNSQLLFVDGSQALNQWGHNDRTPEEKAQDVIRDAEQSKAHLLDVPGKNLENLTLLPQDILTMDNDYQMIDAHLDENMHRHILIFEYIDLSKLLTKGRAREDDQRLEIVNHNGLTFLSPMAERDTIQINSYMKWEQAFRVYSNVITSRYPGKGPELLQYNHTIHSALTAYVWENVYAYDKEFRQHIGSHPTRVWNVILQEAWTMILKDRIKSHGGFHLKGGKGGRKEICKRFNKGCCAYGLACRYDHCCTIKKCGKYRHGAHICRLHGTESASTTASPNKAVGSESTDNSK